jgi:hypothetical protein
MDNGEIFSIGMTNPIIGHNKIGLSCETGEETYNTSTESHCGKIYYKRLRKGLFAKY